MIPSRRRGGHREILEVDHLPEPPQALRELRVRLEIEPWIPPAGFVEDGAPHREVRAPEVRARGVLPVDAVDERDQAARQELREAAVIPIHDVPTHRYDLGPVLVFSGKSRAPI